MATPITTMIPIGNEIANTVCNGSPTEVIEDKGGGGGERGKKGGGIKMMKYYITSAFKEYWGRA